MIKPGDIVTLRPSSGEGDILWINKHINRLPLFTGLNWGNLQKKDYHDKFFTILSIITVNVPDTGYFLIDEKNHPGLYVGAGTFININNYNFKPLSSFKNSPPLIDSCKVLVMGNGLFFWTDRLFCHSL